MKQKKPQKSSFKMAIWSQKRHKKTIAKTKKLCYKNQYQKILETKEEQFPRTREEFF